MCNSSPYNNPYGNAYQTQCTAPSDAGRDAARNLARLMERQLGFSEGHIDSVALRLFIRAYWSRVSSYAHTIHDEKD
jgi:hypothetical protein